MIKRIYFLMMFYLVSSSSVSGQIQAVRSDRSFNILAFYSGDWDVAHISFVNEANLWLDSVAKVEDFSYEATNNWDNLTLEYLAKFDVILFLDNIPTKEAQRTAFKNYMEQGGGFIAFHVAAYNDDPQKWDWYFNHLLGVGRFAGNTWKPTSANLRIEQTAHPVTEGLPAQFRSQPNEWYKWEKDLRANNDIEILLAIDPSSFPLGTGPKAHEIWYSGDYPVVWTHKSYNMLYINMGHNDMRYNPDTTLSYTFQNETQNKLLLNGLKWLAKRSRVTP